MNLGTYFRVNVRLSKGVLFVWMCVLFISIISAVLTHRQNYFDGATFIPIHASALFFILLHEFGHIYMARRFGGDCTFVELGMLGGAAHLTKIDFENPKEEYWVALAGPLVSILLAILFLPLVFYYPDSNWSFPFYVNLFIVAFNFLVPVHPMDSGRLVRALLGIYLIKNFRLASQVTLIIGGVVGSLTIIGSFYYEFYSIAIILPIMFLSGLTEYSLQEKERKQQDEIDNKIKNLVDQRLAQEPHMKKYEERLFKYMRAMYEYERLTFGAVHEAMLDISETCDTEKMLKFRDRLEEAINAPLNEDQHLFKQMAEATTITRNRIANKIIQIRIQKVIDQSFQPATKIISIEIS